MKAKPKLSVRLLVLEKIVDGKVVHTKVIHGGKPCR